MPKQQYAINYGSGATRSAGDWMYRTFHLADAAMAKMIEEHPEADHHLFEVTPGNDWRRVFSYIGGSGERKPTPKYIMLGGKL